MNRKNWPAISALCLALAGAAQGREPLRVLHFDAGSVAIGPFDLPAAEGAALAAHLRVTVGGIDNPPAVAGETRFEAGALRFEPAFPFAPRTGYWLKFDHPEHGTVSAQLQLPAPADTPRAEVVAVYPSGEVLPQNLLRFYIHFSQPMSRGEAYEHIRLMRVDGPARQQVPDAFLELAEELWDADARRLTVLFDPGRLKRGLKPHEDIGPPLEQGGCYKLEILPGWKDAQRRHLMQNFGKVFRAAGPDRDQPDPEHWRLRLPEAGTRRPLVAEFDAPLDHALLERLLEVRRADGKGHLAGKIAISRHETRWAFVPDEPWRAGDYRLVAGSELEDVSGNSIRKPFEVTPDNPGRDFVGPTVTRAFTVQAADE